MDTTQHRKARERCSSVMEVWRIRVRFPAGTKICLFLSAPRPSLCLSVGIKRPGREVNTLYIVLKARKDWSSTSNRILCPFCIVILIVNVGASEYCVMDCDAV
jgi:hypothetical protein